MAVLGVVRIFIIFGDGDKPLSNSEKLAWLERSRLALGRYPLVVPLCLRLGNPSSRCIVDNSGEWWRIVDYEQLEIVGRHDSNVRAADNLVPGCLRFCSCTVVCAHIKLE